MTKTPAFEVEFLHAKAGWLRFKVSSPEMSFSGAFSAVFDPLLKFKAWLEALAVGVEQASFTYDAEGPYITFDWDYNKLVISKDHYETILFSVTTERQHVISTFYDALKDFAESDRYIREEWEEVSVYQEVNASLKLEGEQVKQYLLTLKKDELNQLLGGAPWYLDYSLKIPSFKEDVEQHQHYDHLSTDIKMKLLEHWLESPTKDMPCYGASLKEMRSEIVERYLGRRMCEAKRNE
jgi:hypothetical protein